MKNNFLFLLLLLGIFLFVNIIKLMLNTNVEKSYLLCLNLNREMFDGLSR